MKGWGWLIPGLGLKRWFLLFGWGLLLFASGWAMAFEQSLVAGLEGVVHSGWQQLTGSLLPAPVAGGVLTLLGLALMTGAIGAGYRSVVSTLLPEAGGGIARTLIERRQADRGPRVVAIGGGTGLATLVRGLKQYTSNITAIVTVTDDGGSSGRLVGELGILPPGDIRNVLVALADMEPLMERLLQHRFRAGSLQGHAFGNLLIGALTEILGDFEQAVRESSKVLAVRGRVLPSTNRPLRLVAELADGRRLTGETNIVAARGRIRRLALDPPSAETLPEALNALAEADLIVIGPGSLYTSVLPNLLIPALAEGVRKSRALKVYVVNVMTQPGETDGFSAADHVRALLDHAGPGIVQYALVNTGGAGEARVAAYRAQGALPVRADLGAIRHLGVVPVAADVIADGDLVRHDPERLATALLRLLLRHGPVRARRLFDDFWLSRRLKRR
ncbi:MAG TPA: gluconeogenesis factor YvcK family protein [Bacillota bacterium]